MSPNEKIVRTFIEEAFNRGRVEAIDDWMAPDFVEHQGAAPAGREAPKAIVASLRRAFSDFHLEVQDVASRDDTVWLRLRATGTHDGPFMGHAPTGRRIAITVFDVMRVEGAKIVEHWGVPDAMAALRQIGAGPG